MTKRAALIFAVIGLAILRAAGAQTLSIEVRDAGGAPVADAVVYATALDAAPGAAHSRTATIVQRDREFVPWVTVVQAGTTISFPNADPILHHVYSFSPARPFEIKLYAGETPQGILFNKPGIVTLGCNIHDWMVAYVAVVDTPHFGKTAKPGLVTLRSLPAGRYEVHAWHPLQKAEAPAQPVTFAAGGDRRIEFALDLNPRKPRYKPPMNKLKY